MGLAKMLAVIAFLASSCAAMFYRPDSPCDFTDVSIDNEVFSKLIAKLPEGMEVGPQGSHSFLPGMEVGSPKLHGLNKLRQFGPAIPYCVNGTRMVQVEVFTGGETYLSSPWKTCSDDEGIVMLRAMFTRFTLLFRVVESTPEGVKLELDGAYPTVSQGVRVVVEGAGEPLRVAIEVLTALVPSFMEELWTIEFSKDIRNAFRTLEQ
ncbi:hypothetical protein HPB50_027085 [Hyalomma asiaticum]|uniref:Uncharacterized protein n=1 Tax=Hyalomma asiaticum TaxID=266040 RepID=A0ACB7RZN6_HYAAI|nr:hypothetical protein HPB50_027085 [Hyalomma asiaticum]